VPAVLKGVLAGRTHATTKTASGGDDRGQPVTTPMSSAGPVLADHSRKTTPRRLPGRESLLDDHPAENHSSTTTRPRARPPRLRGIVLDGEGQALRPESVATARSRWPCRCHKPNPLVRCLARIRAPHMIATTP